MGAVSSLMGCLRNTFCYLGILVWRFARSKQIVRIVRMNELNYHGLTLLGLDETRLAESAGLSIESKRVFIDLEHSSMTEHPRAN